jgi:predicted transcriptional regulator
MNPQVQTIRQDEDLYKAFYIMHSIDSENLLVVDNNKKPASHFLTHRR